MFPEPQIVGSGPRFGTGRTPLPQTPTSSVHVHGQTSVSLCVSGTFILNRWWVRSLNSSPVKVLLISHKTDPALLLRLLVPHSQEIYCHKLGCLSPWSICRNTLHPPCLWTHSFQNIPPTLGVGRTRPLGVRVIAFSPQMRPLGGLFSLTKAQIHVDPGPPSPQVQITWGAPPPPQEDPPLYLGFSSATVAALATRGDGDRCLSSLPGETPVNHGLLSGGPPASWVPRPSTSTFLLPVPLLLVPFPLDTQKLLVLP